MPRVCISNKLSVSAFAAGLGTILGFPYQCSLHFSPKQTVFTFLFGGCALGKLPFSISLLGVLCCFQSSISLTTTLQCDLGQTFHFLISRMRGLDCLVSFPRQHPKEVLIILVIIILFTLLPICFPALVHDL